VKGTFKGSNQKLDDNWALAEQQRQWREYGTGFWPSIVINKRTYRGDLDPERVFAALCAGIQNPPDVCIASTTEEAIANSSGITGNILILVVIGLVILNILLIMLYRRLVNREMKEDMQLQVNSAVSQYFALSTKSSNH